MRTTGFRPACLAILTSAQLALATSPAFAQEPAPATPPPPATTAASVPTPTAPPADGTVNVHINSKPAVTLQKRSTPGGAWETVCTSPCDQRVPVGDEYQVTGDGVVASKPFRLDSSRGTVVLDVTPGNPTKEKVGLYVAIGGAVLIVGGAITMIAGAKPSSTFPADGTTSDRNTNVLFVGAALVFSGVVAVIYGGAMMVNNKTSAVEGDVSTKAGPAMGNKDVFVRTAQVPAPTTPTFVVPVFSGTF